MAKTRAQRKAERRAREEQERKRIGGERDGESHAQHDTQVPVSGEIAEIEAVEAGMAVGAPEAALETPDAPKTSRAEKRAEAKALKETEKRKRGEQKRRESEQLAKKQKQAQAQRQRGGVTLVQATAVTIIFVAVAATYLGALDAAFNYLVKLIL
jgi:Flp pilus assembly protein TadB